MQKSFLQKNESLIQKKSNIVGFEKVWKQNWIIIPKWNIIMLNISNFNTFAAKIITSYLTFGDKFHKSKNIYYNIE
jgi:hypothetical protein